MSHIISQIVDMANNAFQKISTAEVFDTVNDTIQAIDMATNHRSDVYIIGSKSGLFLSNHNDVVLSYGERFSIRMLNNTAKRMIASIIIDEEKIGAFVIGSKECLNVSRPINANGKFKFKPKHINGGKKVSVIVEYEDPTIYKGFPAVFGTSDHYRYNLVGKGKRLDLAESKIP
ncbi:hypothetical protein HgNV_057 [Homarus gammarus nudivirus]|uniref:Uncharacterized protein n=1 Tax=Homarus gammarus nudivirus TaxID=2509616 RepID=A0A411HB92_9VIRU|nr:hypothetical protein KM727_gp57 [Homarus gammarus nudivirus]QBB28662.1 hypothetical protein HgNV_057 [Homarus gammarus nudivirus]